MELVTALSEEELGSGTLTRFPNTDGRPFVHVVGWASMEFTKNLAEMCLLRRLQEDVNR